ncbi:MAG: hypothetical protein M0P07_03785, partial [Candidatus Methanomethylophilaceae archaeon]|nr:hypothetical protein [Candidatus Methanomethylophilaceae archaeon]
FTSIAMEAHKPNDHSSRIDEEEHGGDSKCDYSCCTESGYCKPSCNLVLAGLIVACCCCCCYVTHGFNGVWPYWPA